MGPVPPEGNAGNPAFLLNVLLDCFSGWLYLDCFATLAMTETGTEAGATKQRVLLRTVAIKGTNVPAAATTPKGQMPFFLPR